MRQLTSRGPWPTCASSKSSSRTSRSNSGATTTRARTTPTRTSSGSLWGREVVLAITDGKLDFGRWEQIFYGEWDGNRPKRVLVKIIGE